MTHRAPLTLLAILSSAAISCGTTPAAEPNAPPATEHAEPHVAAPPTPQAAPTPQPAPPPATPAPTPTAYAFDPVHPPPRTAPSADEVQMARDNCDGGWYAFTHGDRDTSRRLFDQAIAVLANAEAPEQRVLRGVCLYNRGRVSEAQGSIEEARALYLRSLELRPDARVRARLDALPQQLPAQPALVVPTVPAEPTAEDQPQDSAEEFGPRPMLRPTNADERALFDAADNPYRADQHAAFELTANARVDEHVRVGVVLAYRSLEQDGEDLLTAMDRLGVAASVHLVVLEDGAAFWGPSLYSRSADIAEAMSVTARINTRSVAGRAAPIIETTLEISETESCCGGRSSRDRNETVYCAMPARDVQGRCLHVVGSYIESGESSDPDDSNYEANQSQFNARINLDEAGLVSRRVTRGTPPLITMPTDRRATHVLYEEPFSLVSL